jgi:hypothetical protein
VIRGVFVGVGVAVYIDELVDVAVGLYVNVTLGVSVMVLVGVAVEVFVIVCEGVTVAVGLFVIVALAVAVLVEVCEAVAVAVGVCVAVEVALRVSVMPTGRRGRCSSCPALIRSFVRQFADNTSLTEEPAAEANENSVSPG